MTKKQQIIEMIKALEKDQLRLGILQDYRKHEYENDEELKGNTQAKKELDATDFSMKRNEKMIDWLKKELIKCE